MKAAILAVGSELLGSVRLDTNSLTLTKALQSRGVELIAKAVVGDEEEMICEGVRTLLRRADLLLITGGLGPTADDVTRQGVAMACGRTLHLDADVSAEIEEKFARLGVPMPAINRRQAERIEGAEWIANRRGTARGMRLMHEGHTLFLFPGVPVELAGMIESDLDPWLSDHGTGESTSELTLRTACLPESAVEDRISGAYDRFGRTTISVLASPGEVLVKARATGSEAQRETRLQEVESFLRERLGDAVFATGEKRLEEVVGTALGRRRETVGTAESCTGGLIAERITRVPGSSGWMLGGVVAYSNELKTRLVDVDPTLIESHGAVSPEVAVALARGARSRLGADWGIGVTGIAGPAGGSKEKPVGTVHVAVAGPGEAGVVQHGLHLPGDRATVRQLSSQWGLDMLRRCLSGLSQLPPTSTSPEYSG